MDVPLNTTIAVVDGENFNLSRNTSSRPQVKLTALRDHDTEDRNSASGGSSSAANPGTKQMEEDAFGKGVTDKLNQMVLDGRVETLVVIAAPPSLGEMRRSYHAKLQQVPLGEIDKVLTTASMEEIEKALASA